MILERNCKIEKKTEREREREREKNAEIFFSSMSPSRYIIIPPIDE